MGEKFAVNPVTGTGSLTVPLASSPSRSGFGPQLSLSYDSGAGNGTFGFGWSLGGLPSITRKTDKGIPRYRDADESDVFILSGAEDLVPLLDSNGERVRSSRTVHKTRYVVYPYRPRIEGLFTRVERWVAVETGISHWRTISRDNVTTLYGLDGNSRIADPADPQKIFSYLICRTFDDKGNIAIYDYATENDHGVDQAQAHEANRTPADRGAQRYLKTISYANAEPYYADWSPGGIEPPLPTEWYFQVVLDYGDHSLDLPLPSADQLWGIRPDPFSFYRAGFEIRTYRRCRRVLVFHHFPDEPEVGANCLVRSTDLRYSDDEAPGDPRNPVYTFLASVVQSGYRRKGDGYLRKSMPPLEFEYSQPQLQPSVLTLDSDSLANLPVGLDGSGYEWADLDGEGLPGIVTDFGGEWGYKPNLSPVNQLLLPDGSWTVRARFAEIQPLARLPSRSGLTGRQQLLDLSGDGQLDLVAFRDPNPGFYERDAEVGWRPFRPFASLPHLDWSEPNLTFVDLTGDGLADVLIAEDGVLTFYPSLGEAGFGDAEQVRLPFDEAQGPRIAVADERETVAFADMSGDGLSDIVRIRNGEVCYWPNLGYGHFGPRLTMDRAPRFADADRFDPRRVRLADVDGSGTTDLLYVGEDGVLVCFNRSGNSWGDPHVLAVFPTADSLSEVRTADLLGNGTACLVWSSPLPSQADAPLRYVDLMGGQKPHLLVRVRNNLGAETRLRYAPSTRFYLADRLAGQPWVTRLPFPVHVVERVETYDWIGRSRYVTRYGYSHGFFDGAEREFRGFGLVEQWDTEEHRGDTDFPDADALNWDEASWTPPVRTRTWFHTGAFIKAAKVSRQYDHEYWAEPPLRAPDRAADREAMLLPDTPLPPGLSTKEIREAYRALKGMPLRTETYAEDGSHRAEHPYMVTEQNYTPRLLQPIGTNRHAVFHVQPRERLTFQYERRPEDPRVTHELTLGTDEFGNVLRSALIGYPRRPNQPEPEPDLADSFRKMLAHDQARLHIAATENRFTNALTDPIAFPDVHRTPLPAETLTAELTGLAPIAHRPGIANLFRFDELAKHWSTVWEGTLDVAYEDIAAADLDGTDAPPAGPARRIVRRTRTQYRRDDLTALLPIGKLEPGAIPGENLQLALTPSLITRLLGGRVTEATLEEGSYRQLPDEDGWWIPSNRVYFAPIGVSATTELEEARAHFYLTRRTVDPFAAATTVAYDDHDLLPASTTDPLGNTTAAVNDYRILLPKQITDANGNRSKVAFDALGLVVGSAVMGKEGEDLGDPMSAFESDLDDDVLLAHLADPLVDLAAVLGDASSRLLYDVSAYYRTRNDLQPEPPVVYTLARETHVSDLAAGEESHYQHSYSYSDGFGREIQRKVHAKPGPIEGVDQDVVPRWIGSGWVVTNNKGNPVRKYEPFFSATHRFEFAQEVGVSSVLFYDATGRLVANLRPDNTWEKAVFDGWRQETWDANDTVLASDLRADPDVGEAFRRFLGDDPDSFLSWYDRRIVGTWGVTIATRAAERDAAQKASGHAATPTAAHFDSLGRTCLTVSHNGNAGRYPSRTALDTEGKPLAVFDALGRRVFEYFLREPLDGGGFRYLAGYDLAGRALYENGMDGGERRTLANAAGNVIRSWDSRGHTFRVRYDLLRRPTHRYFRTDGEDEILLERSVYGEGLPNRNLCGRLFRQYDRAGLAVNERYDFKGNLVESTRQLAREYRSSPDWSVVSEVAEVAALDAAAAPLLVEADRFTATTSYDAINRPLQLVTPHTLGMRPCVMRPAYDEGGELERLDVWLRQANAPTTLLDAATAGRHVIVDIDYNARGQRTRVARGNDTVTTYEYDPETFRLVHLVTKRDAAAYPDDCPKSPPSEWPGCQIQNLWYTYDPVGNITRIRDDAQQTIFFRNKRVEPSGDYTYDPLYRLTRATGREHLGQTAGDLSPPVQIANSDASRSVLHPNDGKAMGTYVETYEYDPVGNIQHMVHQVASGGWTRHYRYDETSQITPTESSNRLSSTSLPGDDPTGPYSATYAYDAHGNMIGMPHLPVLTWDEQDRLRSTTRQVANGKTPETTFYTYDAGGSRLRKVVDRQADAGVNPERAEQWLYLGPIEIYRKYAAAGDAITLERETLHVQASGERAAIVETRTIGNDSGLSELVSHQYANHLGSAVLELDDGAAVISYEEYFPYGSTAYQATQYQTETPKRYRFTGKERDKENDLYYHGTRYYAPWLGRWVSVDPAKLADGPDPYAYVRNNPVRLVDASGNQSEQYVFTGARVDLPGGGTAPAPPATVREGNVIELPGLVITGDKSPQPESPPPPQTAVRSAVRPPPSCFAPLPPYIPPEAWPDIERAGRPVPLTKARLEQMAWEQGIVPDPRGPDFMIVGASFEEFGLRSVGQAKNRVPYYSADATRWVVPDGVSDVTRYDVIYRDFFFPDIPDVVPAAIYPLSHFWEVKAYREPIRLSTRNWQIEALIDVASRSPAATAGETPTVAILTTADTDVTAMVVDYANEKNVGLWISRAFEYPDADPESRLQMGRLISLNPFVYKGFVPPLSLETFERGGLVSPKDLGP